MAKRSTSKTRGIFYYIGMGLSVGLFMFVVLVGLLAIVVPAATGSTPLTVLTGSMTPTYPPGTLIIIKPIDSQNIRIGDPITYQIESGKPDVVTHRVVSITSSTDGSRTFETKGDANNAVDQKAVVPDQIRGKVWYAIPYLGYVNTAVNGEARGWLIPLIAGGLFLYVGYLAASALVSKLRNGRKDDDEETQSELASESSSVEKRVHGRRSAPRH